MIKKRNDPVTTTGPLLFNFKMDCYKAIGINYYPMSTGLNVP